MKRFGVIATLFLLVAFLGATAFGYAQQEKQSEKPAEHQKQAKPQQEHAQQQQRHDQNNPQHSQQHQQAKQQHSQDQHQAENKQLRHNQQQANNGHQQHGQNEQHAQNQHPAELQRSQQERHDQEGRQRNDWHHYRAHNWGSEHRDWQQRGGYNGYRIPDNDYGNYYGQGHPFRVYSQPFMVVGGFPRFQYGGYWFSMVDPYPEYWGPSWYQNDDVYVAYVDNGYYLYNRRYPSRRGISISVSF